MDLCNEKISTNIDKYCNIIRRYRNGEFGEKHMSIAEILEAANEKGLLDKMSIDEIQYLIDNSSGLTRMMFLECRNSKIKSEEPHLVLSKNQ